MAKAFLLFLVAAVADDSLTTPSKAQEPSTKLETRVVEDSTLVSLVEVAMKVTISNSPATGVVRLTVALLDEDGFLLED